MEEQILLSKCAVCNSKKSKFIKQQEASELSSSLEIRKFLIKIILLGSLLFQRLQQVITRYKVNEIANKCLLVEDKFMLEMHFKKSGFTCSACRPFTNQRKNTSSKKQEIHDTFTKTNQIKFNFNIQRLMEILKI